MTIEKQKGKFWFECDGCADILETDERDFQTALDVLKSEGWRAIKGKDGEFEHKCSRCG